MSGGRSVRPKTPSPRLSETFLFSLTPPRVVLTLPNGSTYEHEGKLISGGFDINPQTGEQSVLVVFPNPKRILRLGLKVVGTGYEK
jgi:hypothetical protein